MNSFLARTMIHIWCEYGECSLNRSGVMTLTSCYDLAFKRNVCKHCEFHSRGEWAFIEAGAFIMAFTVIEMLTEVCNC